MFVLFVLLSSEVNEQITVWLARRIFICLDGKGGQVRIHLTIETDKLTGVSGILEQDNVLSIQTYRSDMLVFMR